MDTFLCIDIVDLMVYQTGCRLVLCWMRNCFGSQHKWSMFVHSSFVLIHASVTQVTGMGSPAKSIQSSPKWKEIHSQFWKQETNAFQVFENAKRIHSKESIMAEKAITSSDTQWRKQKDLFWEHLRIEGQTKWWILLLKNALQWRWWECWLLSSVLDRFWWFLFVDTLNRT